MLFLLAFLLHPLFAAAKPELPDLPCSDIPSMLLIMQGGHYAQPDFPETVKRSGRKYVELLDSSRSLFLAAEADAFAGAVAEVVMTSRKGDCAPLEKAAQVVIDRSAADLRTVRDMLQGDFQIDPNARLVLEPDKVGWPATEAERQERLRALVAYQVANRQDAGLDVDTAKQKVIHSFELAARRVAERRAPSELPALYVEAFAEALDPHSAFFTAEDLEDFRISTQLSLEGIGASLVSEDGFTKVQSIVPGGPADRDGTLQPGDYITSVAEAGAEPTDIIDMDLQEVVQLIRGAKGTEVTLGILRKGKTTRSFELTLTRDKIDLEDQAASLDVREVPAGGGTLKIGVLDLPSFYGGERGGRSSSRDVAKLLDQAREQGVQGIVLDLSRNGGGLLDEAVDIAGLFFRKGAVVATRDAGGDVEVLDDRDPGIAWSGPLVVLTSPLSASGAEILAGALRDYHRGIIVGMDEHTFGKGTVQQLLPLPDGVGAIKLTTGMFFLPSGRSTQLVGVDSDIVLPSLLDGDRIAEAALDGALPPGEIAPFRSSTVHGTGASAWTPVDEALVARLRSASAERVAADPLFRRIEEQRGHLDDDEPVVTLAELRKEREAAEDGEEVDWDDAHDAFVDEGVRIMADWVGAPGAGGAP